MVAGASGFIGGHGEHRYLLEKKSAHAHIERAGILAMIVNAHFIKYVPGRKTDMGDSEWLAVLARFGLVRGSFISPKDLRELRLI